MQRAVPPFEIPVEFELVTGSTGWKCLRCGWCCNQEWNINLTWTEYDRLRDVFPDMKFIFDEDSGASHPFLELFKGCLQYDRSGRRCRIYSIRPYSCAAFPFLLVPDLSLYVHTSCPGAGRGPTVDIEEKRRELIELKRKAGMDVSIYGR